MSDAAPAPGMPDGLPLRALPLHVFLHVPKTAGTTCRAVFQQMMGDYYFTYDQGVHGAKPGVVQPWQSPEFFHRYLMIGGHVGRLHALVRAARGASRRMVFYGVMRDPVSRAVSFYDYVRKRPRHPVHKEVADRTLAEVVREAATADRSPWVNWQLFQLFGATDPAGIRQAMEGENYVIGRLEDLSGFLDAVAAVTSIPRPEDIPRENVADTAGPVRARDQPDFAEAKERLAELNRVETEFMEQHVRPLLLTTSLARPHGPAHPMEEKPAPRPAQGGPRGPGAGGPKGPRAAGGPGPRPGGGQGPRPGGGQGPRPAGQGPRPGGGQGPRPQAAGAGQGPRPAGGQGPRPQAAGAGQKPRPGGAGQGPRAGAGPARPRPPAGEG